MNKGFSGENLKYILKQKGLTYKAFYSILLQNGYDLGYSTLQNYITNRREITPKNIQLFAEVLNVKIEELFYKEKKEFIIKNEFEIKIKLNREIAKALKSKIAKLNISPEEYIKSLIISSI